ncbi:MAG TPA: class I SAM-dependent methyltransferase [Candidatus Sulfomarinibacteraceae bacterium]|nr:class I SAM-dependent methyltransferase [Candidatus Sulfomarinibacteraceae bacterium]
MTKQDDKQYLTEEQYASEEGLNTRTAIQDRYGTSSTAWFHWVFDHLELAGKARVLDIGSGSGQLWWQNWHQLPAGVRLILSDLSLPMVKAARERMPRYPNQPGITFQVADAEALPVPRACCGVVVALGVLDHLLQPENCLAQVHRVLAPGGMFYTSAGGRRHLHELGELVRPYLPDEGYGGDSERFGLENGRAMLSEWFSTVSVFPFEDMLLFREVGPIVDYVRSEGTVAQKLKGLKLAGFVEQLKQQLAARGEIAITREKALFVARL